MYHANTFISSGSPWPQWPISRWELDWMCSRTRFVPPGWTLAHRRLQTTPPDDQLWQVSFTLSIPLTFHCFDSRPFHSVQVGERGRENHVLKPLACAMIALRMNRPWMWVISLSLQVSFLSSIFVLSFIGQLSWSWRCLEARAQATLVLLGLSSGLGTAMDDFHGIWCRTCDPNNQHGWPTRSTYSWIWWAYHETQTWSENDLQREGLVFVSVSRWACFIRCYCSMTCVIAISNPKSMLLHWLLWWMCNFLLCDGFDMYEVVKCFTNIQYLMCQRD